MELGNWVFGNSRGEFQVPRVAQWETPMFGLMDEICEKMGHEPCGLVHEYENEVFWIFPYYWGDCTCGWDDHDDGHAAVRALRHRPDCYQHEYRQLNRKDDPDKDAGLKALYRKHGWSTEGDGWWHGCAVRCSCDFEERMDEVYRRYAREFGHDGHAPDCLLVKDNFRHKPTGFGIQWYKYPFRDSYMNRDLSLREYRRIMAECVESLRDPAKEASDEPR